MHDVTGQTWSDRAMRGGMLLAVVLGAWIYVRYLDADSPVFDDIGLTALITLSAGGAMFAIGLVLNLLVVAPFQLWVVERDRADRSSQSAAFQGKFDVSSWDNVNVLQIFEAACLWVERSPPQAASDRLPQEALPWLRILKQAIEDRDLPLWNDEDGAKRDRMFVFQLAIGPRIAPAHVPETVEVDRDGLIEYAESIDEKPKFLYPDTENSQLIQDLHHATFGGPKDLIKSLNDSREKDRLDRIAQEAKERIEKYGPEQQ